MSKETKSIECALCNTLHTFDVDTEDIRSWQEGELIQNAMPYLTVGQRELLISGICETCFYSLFGEDTDDEDDTWCNVDDDDNDIVFDDDDIFDDMFENLPDDGEEC